MAQAAPALSAECLAKVKACTIKNFAHFEANVTQAQRDLAAADLENFKNNPEWLATKKAEMDTDFAESDADGDGRLNAAESEVFLGKLHARGAARGKFALAYEGQLAEAYDMYNSVNASEEGYNQAEFFAGAGATVQFWEECKAAKEAGQ
mmetsp:Transcript_9841/g.13436  ORF Transcript_9841/g.13436 Transcript_9841/m.13436 type:complete len:150 (-) Transcript_9841:83-532(-)